MKPKPAKPPKAATKAVPCPSCSGTGKVEARQQTFEQSGDVFEKVIELRCLRCGGTGRWFE